MIGNGEVIRDADTLAQLLVRVNYDDKSRGVVYPVNVDHNGVTGVVAVAFTRLGHAYVSTRAHVNDHLTALTYRGTSFLHGVHVKLEGGAWTWDGDYRGKATRRENWSDATPAQTERLSAALLSIMPRVWADNPDAIRTAEKFNAEMALSMAESDLADLAPKVLAAKKAKRAAQRRLDALTGPQDVPEDVTRSS